MVRRWLAGVGPERAQPLLALREAEVAALPAARRPDGRGRGEAAAAPAARWSWARGRPLETGALALDGRALMSLLGCPPGPHVGEGLRHLLDLALDEPALNTAEALAGRRPGLVGGARRPDGRWHPLRRRDAGDAAGKSLPSGPARPTPRGMLLADGRQVPDLHLDRDEVARCRALADQVTAPVLGFVGGHTTVAIERTVLRLFGLHGAGPRGVPQVNLAVDELHRRGLLGRGAAWWLGYVMRQGARDPAAIVEAIASLPEQPAPLPPAEERALREELARRGRAPRWPS